MDNSVKISFLKRIRQRANRSKDVLFFLVEYFISSQKLYAYRNFSFSQEGEDLVLKRMFKENKKGFYVDVGAHHPQRFSNTYLFYLKGWRGINIDSMPNSMKPFDDLRPEDTNIEAAISNSSEELTYYIFNEPALNSFSKKLAMERDGLSNYKIVDKISIKTIPLSKILDDYLPQGQEINFLSIDVEGLDHQVLLSNDWSKYKPKVILVEELSTSLEDLTISSKTYSLLRSQGYKLCSKTFNTSFYQLDAIE